MTLRNLILFVALTAASAADCANCGIDDETSLVQVTLSQVKKHSERIPNEADDWPTPVHDDYAITDSTPDTLDAGQVTDAFASNADQVRDDIENQAAHRIDFANEQRLQRKSDYVKAAGAVAAEKKAVEEAKAAAKAQVAKTKKHREEVKHAAADRVKEAKESARAHAIKQVQAEKAAALGRKVGTIEGADASHHAWADYKSEVKAEHKAAALEAARERIAKHEAAVKKSVADKTTAMADADDAWVARAKRAAAIAKARAAADAAKKEVQIEGPEGLKNVMTKKKADWAVKAESRKAEAAQASINADAAGSVDEEQMEEDSEDAGPADELPVLGVMEASLAQIPDEAADWSTPVHDWKAESDSMPDELDSGKIMDSFHSNKDHVRTEIEKEATDRIKFAAKERDERKLHYAEAADAVEADKKAVEKAKAADKKAVDEVKASREKVKAEAAKRVKDSKEKAMALHIKADQAEKAARLGRKVGTIEGKDAAAAAWKDYREKVKEEHDATKLKLAKEKLAKKQEAARKIVKDKTAALEKQDSAWVKRADRAAAVAEAKVAAEAAKKETAIEGPEGLKNRLTSIKADWAVTHYDRDAKADEKRIMKAATGKYPAGSWPVGP